MEQMDAPSPLLNVPGLHAAGTSTPVEQNEPSTHAVHCSSLPRSVEAEYVPAGHGSGADEPSPQK